MYIFMLWHLWFMFTFGGFIFPVYRLSCPSRPLPATLSLNSHLFQCVKQKMNFLNFLHRLKMAHFIFVFILAAAAVVIAAVLWKRDLFVYSSSFSRGLLSLWPQGPRVADSFFRAEVSAQKYAICLTEQKRCDSHTIKLTLSADDYYSSFIWCSLFLIYVLSLLI